MTKVAKVFVQKDPPRVTMLKEVSFRAAVEFGRPSKECENYGICRLELFKFGEVAKKRTGRCKYNNVISDAVYCPDTGELELTFLKADLEIAIQQKYFATAFFKVEEVYQNRLWLEDFGFFIELQIDPGHYPILDRAGYYILQFTPTNTI